MLAPLISLTLLSCALGRSQMMKPLRILKEVSTTIRKEQLQGPPRACSNVLPCHLLISISFMFLQHRRAGLRAAYWASRQRQVSVFQTKGRTLGNSRCWTENNNTFQCPDQSYLRGVTDNPHQKSFVFASVQWLVQIPGLLFLVWGFFVGGEEEVCICKCFLPWTWYKSA